MGVFNVLKKKEREKKIDIPPPPPIPRPIARPKPQLILPKKVPEVPKFKPIPRFRPRRFGFKPTRPLFKPKVPKLAIPKFKPREVEKPKVKPVELKSYIDIDSFRDVMGHVNEIKKKIKESEDVLVRLNEIKNKEDKEFEKWHSKFEDVQRKLVYVDKFLGG